MYFRLSKIKVITYVEVQVIQNSLINFILVHVEGFLLFSIVW